MSKIMFVDDGSGYNLCDYPLYDILADAILCYLLPDNYDDYVEVLCYKTGYTREYIESRVVHLANSLKVLQNMESMQGVNIPLSLAKKEVENWRKSY